MTVTILTGDCMAALDLLPDESVHCCVTSPPYWGLRDYGTARWEGGNPACDHRSPTMRKGRNEERTMLKGSPASNMGQLLNMAKAGVCGKCGAIRVDQQMGLEATLNEHIAKMVEVFREVRRVLRSDGTCWINYGDCYATSPNGRSAAATKAAGKDDRTFRDKPFSTIGGVLKGKDLCMVPNRLAIALQEDGWWVRSEIIWHKPNPMPESIKDRPGVAHEKIWLLSKSPKYFYDADAVRQPMAQASMVRLAQNIVAQKGSTRANGGAKSNGTMKAVGNPRRDVVRANLEHPGFPPSEVGTRNLRNVWTISPKGFKGAHFATFPPALIEPCILASTSEAGCCPSCGTPWARQVERHFEPQPDVAPDKVARGAGNQKPLDASNKRQGSLRGTTQVETLGWVKGCTCPDHEPVPCTVLDPFGGAGTTGLVAQRFGRDAILIELNPDYAEMARKRIAEDAA